MKSIGQQIDALRLKDNEIAKQEAIVKKLKQDRELLEKRLLRSFDKDDIEGAKGKIGVASIKRSSFPSIKDRHKFIKYILKNKAWDLFQNRIAARAYFDRLEEGESVPGVAVFEKIKVSVKRRS